MLRGQYNTIHEREWLHILELICIICIICTCWMALRLCLLWKREDKTWSRSPQCSVHLWTDRHNTIALLLWIYIYIYTHTHTCFLRSCSTVGLVAFYADREHEKEQKKWHQEAETAAKLVLGSLRWSRRLTHPFETLWHVKSCLAQPLWFSTWLADASGSGARKLGTRPWHLTPESQTWCWIMLRWQWSFGSRYLQALDQMARIHSTWRLVEGRPHKAIEF